MGRKSKKGGIKIKETEIAEKAVKWLEYHGWKVYKEVALYGMGGSIRIDILAVKDGIYWGLEVKSTYCFKVMSQAYKWYNHVHKVSIVVPDFYHQKKDHSDLKLAASICKDYLNIGLIEVPINDGGLEYFRRRYRDSELSDDELYYKYVLKIKFDPEPRSVPEKELPKLYEEQLDSIAGNNKSAYHTEFKGTIKKINIFLTDKDEYDFMEMIKAVGHHYSNDNSAKNCLKAFITEKFIPGFQLEKRSNKLWITRIKSEIDCDKTHSE